MTESRSLIPAVFDTASDLALLVILAPVLLVLLIIGPGLFIWFFNPWGVLFAIVFYNIPFCALGYAVWKDPENKGLQVLWLFQMVTAYFACLLAVPME